MRPFVAAVPLVVVSLLLGACATIVARPDHHFEIVADVEASCEVTDKAGSRSMSAPGLVAADPRHGPARIECVRDGYKRYTTVVDSEFNAAVVGNLIIGGVIGAAVDTATGNHKRYPPHVFVVMEPENFETESAREQWLSYREEKLAALQEEHAPKNVNPNRDDPSLQ